MISSRGGWVISGILALLAGVLIAVLPRDHEGNSPLAPELPVTVPREGLDVSHLYGRQTPMLLSLYPGARLYGSEQTAMPSELGGPAVFILMGVYASPAAVGDFYARRLESFDVGRNELGGDYCKIDARNGEGRIYVQVISDRRGLSRDFKSWRPDILETKGTTEGSSSAPLVGGDPAETMVTLTVKWWKEPLPERVPPAGFVVRTLYGRAVPEPLPLYPGGTVYGSTLGPVTLGRPAMAATILMGSYDDWERVADYYERTWVGKREEEERTSQWSTVQFRTEKPRGNRAAVWVEHDSRGLSRDLSEWNAVTEGADPDSIRHGDPRETMIYVIVRWSGE